MFFQELSSSGFHVSRTGWKGKLGQNWAGPQMLSPEVGVSEEWIRRRKSSRGRGWGKAYWSQPAHPQPLEGKRPAGPSALFRLPAPLPSLSSMIGKKKRMRQETLDGPAASSSADKLLPAPGGGVPPPWAESPGDGGRGWTGFKGPEVRGGGGQRQGCQ